MLTVIAVAVVLPVQIALSPWDPDREATARLARVAWSWPIFLAQPFWSLTLTGVERLRGGPWVIVANHQSILDILALMTLPTSVRFVARPGVFELPVFGLFAAFGRHVRLDASAPGGVAAGLERCRYLLGRGVSVVLFPEGTRSEGAELGEFQRGAFQLAIDTGANVLPVCLDGTGDVMPKGRLMSRRAPSRVRVHVLEPLMLDGRNRRQLAKLAQERIAEAIARPHPADLAASVGQRYRTDGFLAARIAAGKVRYDPVYWALLERLPADVPIVDLGCGEGLLACTLRAGGRTQPFRGVDVDEHRVARARRACPDAAFEVGDIGTVALDGCQVIVCVDVLHYLPPARQRDVLVRLCAALPPDGRLYVREGEPGWRGRFTVASERVAVAIGRHRGEGVAMLGCDAIAAELRRHLVDVQVEDCGNALFANRLVSGRRAA